MDINTISNNTRCHILKQCGSCKHWRQEEGKIGVCKIKWGQEWYHASKVKTLARGHCKEWKEK